MSSKYTLIPMFFLAFLLAACTPSSHTDILDTLEQTPAQVPTEMARVSGTRTPGCTVVIRQPTPNPTEESLLLPPSEKDWGKGSHDAYVTIIEYGDFQ